MQRCDSNDKICKKTETYLKAVPHAIAGGVGGRHARARWLAVAAGGAVSDVLVLLEQCAAQQAFKTVSDVLSAHGAARTVRGTTSIQELSQCAS